MQTAWDLVCGVVITGHRGRGGPCEIIVQHASELFILGQAGIFQRLIETRDRPLVHLLVRPVAAMNPDHRGLITVPVGVRRWATECLRPIRGEALGVLRMVTVAESMANHFVFEHPRVPRVGQLQHPLATTGGVVDRLHDSGLYFTHSQNESILPLFRLGRENAVVEIVARGTSY